MGDLKLYFVMFAAKDADEKEWTAHYNYIFARDELTVFNLINEQYDSVHIRSVQQVNVEEGTILYGKSWSHL